MALINQKIALRSLESALIPKLDLIDGRSEIDRLKFLTEYASLINFYDQENKINGTWNPFLMKDPVFLLANVAKINFSKIERFYQTATVNLKQQINNNSVDISIYFNQLLNQLLNVFMKIERWSYFMNNYHHDYSLKQFVIHQLQLKISAYFWAIIALFKDAVFNKSVKGIQTINTSLFENFSQEVWPKSNKPYWEVLNVEMPLEATENKRQIVLNKILNALLLVGNELFNFLKDIINHAAAEYDSLSVRKGFFPDTALLRAFVKLQSIQQEQLNGISKKHLNFYFEEVLHQNKKNATGDRAFIVAELAKKESTFQLPKGTVFKAGVDVNKNPILFESIKSTNLNAGFINGGFTILQDINKETELVSLYKTPVVKPNVIKKNKEGNFLSWDTFGSNKGEFTKQVSMGFAFASPLLYLKEGTRVITLTLSFKQNVNYKLFTQANYYLSTKTEWLPLSQSTLLTPVTNHLFEIKPLGENKQQITLQITLNETEKPIENFTKNPDGITALFPLFPLFKVVFHQFDNLATPPVFSKIDIDVQVSNVKGLTLSNDYGLLNIKKPYQPFGPTPVINNSFIIGSEEIFSKSISALNLQINWENLPTDFQNYYQEYNNNLGLESTTEEDTTTQEKTEPFNNICFTSDFEILQNKQWNTIETGNKNTLFEVNTDHVLQPNSAFSFQVNLNTINPDGNLQLNPLEFTDKSKNGFLKMKLTGPKFGFGSAVYPKIVSNISLKNAQQLIAKKAITNLSANLPYVPEIKLLTANYKAAESISFTTNSSKTHFQVFTYTPTNNYKVYDSNESITSQDLLLFPKIVSKGNLYLSMDKLVAPCELNIYFELARETENSPEKETINYSYLSASGWKDLPIIIDGTKNFTCSGIVKVSIPDDIASEHINMPNNKFWLSIGVKNMPSEYPSTVYIQNNGFEVRRTGKSFLVDENIPKLLEGKITKTEKPTPEISKITQVFPSFSGRGAENSTKMHQRVSTRLKTKDRAINSVDYYRLIQQEFPDIFYSKCIYDKASRKTKIYLVKKFEDETSSGAFKPFVSACKEALINEYLTKRSSAFAQIEAMNFTPQYISITAKVSVNKNYGLGEVQKRVNKQLKLFLSPWIQSQVDQLEIDQGVTKYQILNTIKKIEGVLSVSSIQIDNNDLDTENKPTESETLIPKLLVTAENHHIDCYHVL